MISCDWIYTIFVKGGNQVKVIEFIRLTRFFNGTYISCLNFQVPP